jgi:hypothetical protein
MDRGNSQRHSALVEGLRKVVYLGDFKCAYPKGGRKEILQAPLWPLARLEDHVFPCSA